MSLLMAKLKNSSAKSRGASIATFYSMTFWPGRYDKIIKYLVRGKAVVVSGEMYQSKYKNSEGGFGSKLIIELSSLKSVLKDLERFVDLFLCLKYV